MYLISLTLMTVFLGLISLSTYLRTVFVSLNDPDQDFVNQILNFAPVVGIAGFFISYSLGFEAVIRLQLINHLLELVILWIVIFSFQ